MQEYWNIKTFLQNVTLLIGLKFVIKKVKNTVSWTYIISDISGEEIVETFHKKELRKTTQKEFIVGQMIKNYMSNGKATIILLTLGLIKEMLL